MGRIGCKEELCVGCLACVVSCIDQHYDENEEHAVSALIYEKKKSKKSELMSYKTRCCLQCTDAKCLLSCRVGALYRGSTGNIEIKRELCVGCHACAKACPYDMIRFAENNRVVKCDGCAERVRNGLKPACVRACPTGALYQI